jgi:hypothetical protein
MNGTSILHICVLKIGYWGGFLGPVLERLTGGEEKMGSAAASQPREGTERLVNGLMEAGFMECFKLSYRSSS